MLFAIVMMTQHSTFLHANIRKLVNVHIHSIASTKASAFPWEWREAHDDVQDSSLRQLGEFNEWPYPQHLYQFYKSASLHTKCATRSNEQVKGRIAKYIALSIVAGFLVVLGWAAWKWKHPDTTSGVAGNKALSKDMAVVQSSAKKWSTTRDYVLDQAPRIASQPWSAPIYDGRP
jgi:zona occludens toxin